jgi:hypothetical protein
LKFSQPILRKTILEVKTITKLKEAEDICEETLQEIAPQ